MIVSQPGIAGKSSLEVGEDMVLFIFLKKKREKQYENFFESVFFIYRWKICTIYYAGSFYVWEGGMIYIAFGLASSIALALLSLLYTISVSGLYPK